MTILNKSIMICAVVALAACSSPDRFANTSDGVNAGSINGPASDPRSAAYFQQTVGDRVLFAVDQSTLSPQARGVLDAQAQWLATNSDYNALIEGHADEQGTREYNLALGSRRANAVQEYLISKGVSQARLSIVTYGKERPLEICSEEACYNKNRRAVTVISAGPVS
ncbi:MAG: peptidoglycan-associated lipoprotein Pal [Pseudomonadota bacterium]